MSYRRSERGAPGPQGLAGASPRVAILGRPNVGKSTLFNALIGRRRAITHESPGVTRDTVEAPWRIGDRVVTLVDTGGVVRERRGLAREVVERSLREARLADVALLVLDAVETTAEDDDLVERLRPLGGRVVLVVNKVDTPDREPMVWNRLALGFARVVGVSAAHRRGLESLRETVSSLLWTPAAPAAAAAHEAEGPEAAGPEAEGAAAEGADASGGVAGADEGDGSTGGLTEVRIAILGKPNTGKSSLANRLLGRERSIVSEIPGTTRDVVEDTFRYRGTRMRILDTAGMRRRTHVKDAVEYYSVARAMESVRQCDVVILLADAREDLSDQDKKIAALAVQHGRGIILALNKADLLGRRAGLERDLRDRVRFRFPVLQYAPVVATSAKTGAGVGRLLATALDLASQLTTHAGTGQLNQALGRWLTHYPLPVRGKNYHIRYLVQVGTNPVRFAAFVNRLAGFPLGYLQYLENCLRREFGFTGVPVSVELRRSPRSPGRSALGGGRAAGHPSRPAGKQRR